MRGGDCYLYREQAAVEAEGTHRRYEQMLRFYVNWMLKMLKLKCDVLEVSLLMRDCSGSHVGAQSRWCVGVLSL